MTLTTESIIRSVRLFVFEQTCCKGLHLSRLGPRAVNRDESGGRRSEPSGVQRHVERAGFQGMYAQSAVVVRYRYCQGMYLSLATPSPCIRTLRCSQSLQLYNAWYFRFVSQGKREASSGIGVECMIEYSLLSVIYTHSHLGSAIKFSLGHSSIKRWLGGCGLILLGIQTLTCFV